MPSRVEASGSRERVTGEMLPSFAVVLLVTVMPRIRREELVEELRAPDRARNGTSPGEIKGKGHDVGSQQRREPMPRYEFMCETCKKGFEMTMSIAERENAKVRCPTCKGTKVVPQLALFSAQTSRKS